MGRTIILLVAASLALPALAATPAPSGAAAKSKNEKTLIWPDGTRYIGGVKNGKRSGKGTIFWKDGTRFVGTFKDDKRNGPGTMVLPDGTVYSGYFENDELVDAPADVSHTESGAETVASNGKINDDSGSQAPTQHKPSTAASTKPAVANAKSSPPEAETPAPQVHIPGELPVTQMTETAKKALKETIDLWAAAWSEENVTQYLANYADDFQVPGKMSRKRWEATRRTRLTHPDWIKVSIDYRKFELIAPNIAEVTFRQAYKSNTYHDVTTKKLRLRKEGHYWRIIRETGG